MGSTLTALEKIVLLNVGDDFRISFPLKPAANIEVYLGTLLGMQAKGYAVRDVENGHLPMLPFYLTEAGKALLTLERQKC